MLVLSYLYVSKLRVRERSVIDEGSIWQGDRLPASDKILKLCLHYESDRNVKVLMRNRADDARLKEYLREAICHKLGISEAGQWTLGAKKDGNYREIVMGIVKAVCISER